MTDPLNLWAAWSEYAAGKRRRPTVAAFELDAPARVAALTRRLADGTWEPGRYRLIRVTDPKRRLVAAAPVRDRVVHHAVHRVLSPLLDRSFVDTSFACIAGRGSHRALLRLREGLRRHRYVLMLDIRRYFYEIDREVLRGLLHRRLREAPLRALLDRILDSGAGLYQQPEVAAFLGWECLGEPGRGLPIGNLTSQWWGNLYLDGLDHHAKRHLRVPTWLRYMDDLILMADDPDALVHARDAVGAWLARERGLALRDASATPRRTSGWHTWLGYQVCRGGMRAGPRIRRALRDAALSGDARATESLIAAARFG